MWPQFQLAGILDCIIELKALNIKLSSEAPVSDLLSSSVFSLQHLPAVRISRLFIKCCHERPMSR